MANDAGHPLKVAFVPGRVDASQEQTDPKSFAVLEPTADAFRNYFAPAGQMRSPAELMVDRANLLTQKSTKVDGLYEGHDRKSGKLRWTATSVDLVFGSNSELRAVSEVSPRLSWSGFSFKIAVADAWKEGQTFVMSFLNSLNRMSAPLHAETWPVLEGVASS